MHAAALVLIAAAAVRMHVQVSTDVEVLVDRMGRYYSQFRRFTTAVKIIPLP